MSAVCQHWTKLGTFRIEPVVLGGSWHYVLWCGETNLGPYSYPWTAAASVGEGKHDRTLGFDASTLGVPPDLRAWNGFK
jgi:hypothetical protein